MWTVADDMIREANALGISVEVLSADAADRVHTDLRDTYGRAGECWPLWDGPSCDPSFQAERVFHRRRERGEARERPR